MRCIFYNEVSQTEIVSRLRGEHTLTEATTVYPIEKRTERCEVLKATDFRIEYLR